MKQLRLRFAGKDEAEVILDWLERGQNDFDPGILQYPTLQVLCAQDDSGAVAYLPIHRAVVMESTALKPGISVTESAQALRDFTKATELVASSHGAKEIYTLMKDASLIRMAENHGFEDVTKEFKVLRMKL